MMPTHDREPCSIEPVWKIGLRNMQTWGRKPWGIECDYPYRDAISTFMVPIYDYSIWLTWKELISVPLNSDDHAVIDAMRGVS